MFLVHYVFSSLGMTNFVVFLFCFVEAFFFLKISCHVIGAWQLACNSAILFFWD